MKRRIKFIAISVICLMVLISIIICNKTVNKSGETVTSKMKGEEDILNIEKENSQNYTTQVFQNEYDNVN